MKANERTDTAQERLREAFTSEAREERLLRGEHERQRRSALIGKSMSPKRRMKDD